MKRLTLHRIASLLYRFITSVAQLWWGVYDIYIFIYLLMFIYLYIFINLYIFVNIYIFILKYLLYLCFKSHTVAREWGEDRESRRTILCETAALSPDECSWEESGGCPGFLVYLFCASI
jgi:small-conductance mechanosensitive channel